MDQEVINLSGGELQRVAICLCLGKVILLFLLIQSVALFASFFLIGHRMSGDNKCSMFK
jgi:translation initiation factor RLI1